MFAIMLSEMGPFIQNISSFPTAIYTVLLGVCIVFWLIAALGLIDLEVIDIDLDLDLDLDLDIHGLELDIDGDSTGLGVLAGLLFRFGLVGVPLTISITILVLVGWLLSYYTVHFLYPFIPTTLLQYLVSVPVFFVTLYLGAKTTGYAIRPLKRFFDAANQKVDKKILGQTVIVRTSRVDNDFGEAVFDDGGAGLILKVRSRGDERFSKGDRVVILENINDEHIFHVMSEKEFMS